ncbi:MULTISPECIES: hypothetical protein [Bifidobacterium]|uniref:hypothetical protein n=1 Tax=Bifidobacterium TaxID=1678 RepID=UPI001BDD983E|nr:MULTISPECIES: hypothetical protein [Bifidobacterium]MBT1162592.1 hypothetical protein [Bifidobacterium sp. SO1]MBW3079689.1 hypothetical protein [Bifidobacterium simiiventris]
MTDSPFPMYDNRHTAWYDDHQEPDIDIHPHALTAHGLTSAQIESAFVTRIGPARIRARDHDADPPRWAAVGFDQQRRAIELVYVKTADKAPLIIHANYLTKGFFKEWSQA